MTSGLLHAIFRKSKNNILLLHVHAAEPVMTSEKSYFEQQRDALAGEIAVSLEHVLQNINKLNRSLEGVIAVGNEFGSVEALWSQFEGVMAKEGEGQGRDDNAEQERGEEESQQEDGEEQEEDTTVHG
ncbi:MAG: hypothetical protein M1837_003240 [Sclerophora amabilis]|nr:MAG: hypothetical protein M1837_003240 [Sclerophora amabilis]